MASVQQLETAVKILEDKVKFFMTATRMRTMVEREVPGPGGETITTQVPVEGTLEDFYLAAQGAGMEMDQRG